MEIFFFWGIENDEVIVTFEENGIYEESEIFEIEKNVLYLDHDRALDSIWNLPYPTNVRSISGDRIYFFETDGSSLKFSVIEFFDGTLYVLVAFKLNDPSISVISNMKK
jgi:hypothetical protein